MRKSIIYNFSEEEIRQIIDKSSSLKEALNCFGLANKGGNNGTLKRACKKFGIDIQPLINKGKNQSVERLKVSHALKKRTYEDMFCENSDVQRHIVKREIIKDNLIEYKCRKCSNEGIWLDEVIVLHLEHKNGINNDNRLENLEFLCPNCHSQTPTYAGRNL